MLTTTAKSLFQFRFENTRWQDIELSAKTLNEIAYAVTSVIGARNPSATYPEIYKMIRENHLATRDQDPKLHGITNLKFEIESNEDDVLKVKYGYTKMYGTAEETELAVKARKLWNRRTEAKRREVTLYEDKEPVEVVGKFTVMPGN